MYVYMYIHTYIYISTTVSRSASVLISVGLAQACPNILQCMLKLTHFVGNQSPSTAPSSHHTRVMRRNIRGETPLHIAAIKVSVCMCICACM